MTQTAGSLGRIHLDDPRRRIELSGVLNLRDVGGYPVEGGGTVRWRTLFRSDALHGLDAAGAAALAGFGVRTVLDLRTQAEADLAPSPVAGRVTHLPLIEDLQALPAPELAGIYRYVVTERGDAIAAAIAELTSYDALPALVHSTVS